MGGLRSILCVCLLLPLPLRATEDALASAFAACAGRFSAELEHAWLMPQSNETSLAQRRQQFIELLDATVPQDRRRHALGLRVDAKMAHAFLLSQATFSDDPQRSAWALRRAKSEIAYCYGFLLES